MNRLHLCNFALIKFTPSGKFASAMFTTILCALGVAAQVGPQNYIRVRTPRAPILSQTTLDANTGNTAVVKTTYNYFDEFGRDLQKIDCQLSPGGNDVVQASVYDNMGRQAKKYLPYAVANTPAGALRGSPTGDVTGDESYFYNIYGPNNTTVATTSAYFSETVYDHSPLARITEQSAPGESWQLGTGKTVKTAYGTNVASEIRLWTVSSTGASSATYQPGALNAVTITDENGYTVTQYKDFDGQLICKKVQTGPSSYVYTDYVYDDAGNLRYVIPPLPTLPTVVTLPTSFVESDAVFANFFYGYHYDGRNRVIEKKKPGSGWEYLVYNSLDQAVLTQTPSQLALGVWLYSKYDSKGRVVMSGEWTTSSTRASLQTATDQFLGPLFETFTNATTNFGYTDSAYPNSTVTGTRKIFASNYYDSYAFLTNTTINPNSAVFIAPTQDTIYKVPGSLLTGSLTNVIGASTSTYLLAITHYDTYGHAVKTVSQSFYTGSTAAGNYDIAETQYAFTDPITYATRQHYLGGILKLSLNNRYNYDYAGRRTLARQQFNSQPTVYLAKYEYNELGQLITKRLHSTSTATPPPASSFLQHVDFRYNTRSWLTRINNPSNIQDETFTSVQDLFAEQIDYDHPNSGYTGAVAQFNGNISTFSWQTLVKPGVGLVQEVKGYDLRYDPANRLTFSYYKSPSGNDKYNEAMTYDELGNILSLNRNASSTTFLNKLTYNYGTGSSRSNALLGVTDGGGSENYTSTFSYQPSGSEKANSKKLVSNINYNELNLPSLITLTSGKTIAFIYSATGQKLERVTKQGTSTVEDRNYINGIEYDGSTFNFIRTEEGRARQGSTNYIYEYQIADHLGNVRALFGDEDGTGTFSAANDIVQLIDYYAFGRQISMVEPNPLSQYKYNGKELLSDLESYDYGARYLNPVTGRWNAVDNEAVKARRWSPYAYAYNNPIRNTDPDGNSSMDYAYAYAQGNLVSSAQYQAQNDLAYQTGVDMWEANYENGSSLTRPQQYEPWYNANLEAFVKNQYSAYDGKGPSDDYGGAYYALNSSGSGSSSSLNWGGLGNFLTHLTPFGGVVDFARSASDGNVGGAILGLASTAAFFTGEGEVSNTMVYRGASESPFTTFENGFVAKGENRSLVSHAYNAPDSYYIPTSFSKEVATSFRQPGGFVYTIRQPPNGKDLNAIFGTDYEFYDEYEWAVPHSIPGSYIHGAQQILPGGKLGDYIYNPFYK